MPLDLIPDLLFLCFLLVVFPLQNLWRTARPGPVKPPRAPLETYWRQACFVLVLLLVLALVMWTGQHTLADLGLAFPASRGGIGGLVAACVLMVAAHIAGTVMERRMTPEKRAAQAAELRDMPLTMPRTPFETVAYLVTMVGMTAMWEVLFRGYALLILAPFIGMPAAVAVAAISYGAGHGYKNPKQFFGSIGAAFAFTIGYVITGSLWWLIVLHAAAPVSMLFYMRKMPPLTPARDPTLVQNPG
jgi:membrane protease YdiL (CAAX protease family)